MIILWFYLSTVCVLGILKSIYHSYYPVEPVAERKNFKLLFSVGIILAIEASILYFQPMRMVYAILLGSLSRTI